MSAVYGARCFTWEEREALIAQIVENYGKPQRALARRFGVSQSTIAKYTAVARTRGLIDESRKRSPEAREALLADLAKPDWNAACLARRHNYSTGAIYYHARKNGYFPRGLPVPENEG